jgi:PQQ-like domain
VNDRSRIFRSPRPIPQQQPPVGNAAPRSGARGPTLRPVISACAAVLVAALAGCAGPSKTEVPGAPQALTAPSFSRGWAMNLGLKDDEVIRLYVRENLLFVYTRKGNAYLIKRDDGTVDHADAVPGGNYRMRPPVLLKDRVIYPTTNELTVFTRAGVQLAPIDLNAALRSNAVGYKNFVFVAIDSPSGGARVEKIEISPNEALDPRAASGRVVWELQAARGGISAAPAVHQDVLYAASEAGLVYAVSVDTREPIWPIENGIFGQTFDTMGAPVLADLVADDTGLYVATSGEGKLYCLNRITGQVKWQYYGSGSLTSPPVVLSDTVYQLDPNRGMVALNKLEDPELKEPQYNRKPRWALPEVRQILAQDDKYTYAVRKDGVIVALDKQTGETQFTSRRKDFAAFATNHEKDSGIYVATKGGRVLQLKPVFESGQVGEVVDAAREQADEGREVLAMYRVGK